jgi:hypothetical protein
MSTQNPSAHGDVRAFTKAKHYHPLPRFFWVLAFLDGITASFV